METKRSSGEAAFDRCREKTTTSILAADPFACQGSFREIQETTHFLSAHVWGLLSYGKTLACLRRNRIQPPTQQISIRRIHSFFNSLSNQVYNALNLKTLLHLSEHHQRHSVETLYPRVLWIVQVVLLKAVQYNLKTSKPDVPIVQVVLERAALRNLDKLVQIL